MNWDALAAISQLFAAIGVMVTLVYLALEVRTGNKLASAQSRHTLSQFILSIAMFKAEHADRLARISNATDLTDGDRIFQYWSHVQVLLHAETYFHHHELELMPDSHWRGYTHFITGYVSSPGFASAWAEVGPAFSESFRQWVDSLLARQRADTPVAN